jgi:hypothetical protein
MLQAATRLILRIARTDIIRAQRKNLARIQASTADVIRIQGTQVNARRLREYAAYDPAPPWPASRSPYSPSPERPTSNHRPKTSKPSASLSVAPSKATSPTTSATCYARTPPASAPEATAAPRASQSALPSLPSPRWFTRHWAGGYDRP